ncbi:CPBP family intramembrane glutamic endopeptidase [Hamadaea tsunoensis]|uniref:CPBP family intramembrane glutamic endopeptidase n=1 Tax=Hamadaea tsunoensis TaxID=53368 RepID=UPI00146FBFF6|nr:type II CAAX endopeptidase family protein [Hamadaea tsunoensis]
MTSSRVRYPAMVFYLTAMVGAGALGAVQPWTGLDPEILQLTQFGPALGVLVASLLWRGERRTVSLWSAVRPWPTGGAMTLAGIAAAVFALCLGCYAIIGADPHLRSAHDLVAPFGLIAVAQFAGACAEEIGWRAFLQPLLGTRMRTLPASLVVGFLWAGWHVPVFAQGVGYSVAFVAMAVSLSVILGVVLGDRRGNYLLPAAVFHTLINLGLLMIFDEESGSVAAMTTFAMVCSACALVSVLVARTRTARNGSAVATRGSHATASVREA